MAQKIIDSRRLEAFPKRKCSYCFSRKFLFVCFVCLFVLLLYVPSQQLWSWLDGQFTQSHFFPGKLEQIVSILYYPVNISFQSYWAICLISQVKPDLGRYIVSCSWTQHSTPSASRTSSHSIPSLPLFH